MYSCRDIRWDHRYKDITSLSVEGRLVLDYSLFHEVEPDGTPGVPSPSLTDASEDAGAEEALSEP